jgi:hypothetical protein
MFGVTIYLWLFAWEGIIFHLYDLSLERVSFLISTNTYSLLVERVSFCSLAFLAILDAHGIGSKVFLAQ